MNKVIIFDDQDGNEMELPGRYEVCWNCEGKGTQVNPAVDGHGISPDEFYEDPDFAENYFSGVYDIYCIECKGERVILEPDEDRANPELLALYYERMDEKYAYEMERAAEMRWGY